MFSRRIPHIVLLILPIALILPSFITLAGVRLAWYEIVLFLVFSFNWRNGANYIMVLLLIFCFITALSTYFAPFSQFSSPNLSNFSIIKYSISYIAALQLGLSTTEIEFSKKNIYALLSFLILVLLVVVAIYSEDLRSEIESIYGVVAFKTQRLQLIDVNPVVLGSTSIVLLFFAVQGRSYFARNVLFALSLIPVFGSQQRTSFMLIVILYLLTMPVFSSLKKSLIVGLLLFTVLSGDMFFQSDLVSKYTTRFSSPRVEGGLSSRINVYEEALNSVIDYPIMGVGRYVELRHISDFRINRIESHSQYVGVLYECGLLGLIPFTLLFGSVVRGTLVFRHNNDSDVGKSLFAFVSVYIVSMLVWETLYFPHFSVIFFFAVGMIMKSRYGILERNDCQAKVD